MKTYQLQEVQSFEIINVYIYIYIKCILYVSPVKCKYFILHLMYKKYILLYKTQK